MQFDLEFGFEEVCGKKVDIGALADALYDAGGAVTEASAFKSTVKEAEAINGVLEQFGLPKVEASLAAFKLAQDVMARAIELKKVASDVWLSADEPASPNPTPDSE